MSGSLQSFALVALGFAVAGALATGYQLLAHRPPSFALLARCRMAGAFAALPFLAFAAPFVIMRSTLSSPSTGDFRRFQVVMAATVVSGFWSLMSGMAVAVLARPLLGLLAG